MDLVEYGMKIIIAGSRSLNDRLKIEKILDKVVSSYELELSEIVCGGARGVDAIGALWARSKGVPVKYFYANWKKYGKVAGYRRNGQMAKYADGLIAIWDGNSRGTKHMIDLAASLGLLCIVEYV